MPAWCLREAHGLTTTSFPSNMTGWWNEAVSCSCPLPPLGHKLPPTLAPPGDMEHIRHLVR